jgi:hypothetical protein
MVRAKVAKMKRKERKIFILKYLYFVCFAKSLCSLRGLRLLIQPHLSFPFTQIKTPNWDRVPGLFS